MECVEEFTYLGIVITKKGLTNKTEASRETASKKQCSFFLVVGRKTIYPLFSYRLYLTSLSLYKRRLIIFKWLDQVVNILNNTGFSYVFLDQLNFDEKYFKKCISPRNQKRS